MDAPSFAVHATASVPIINFRFGAFTAAGAAARTSQPCATVAMHFADPDLITALHLASDATLDTLDFGVIAMDSQGVVRRYNRFESEAAGLSRERVLGQPLFTVVAPCMNNFMVAQRFEDAEAEQVALDDTIPYVLTLRMRPVKVRLRLLFQPGIAPRFVLVDRST